MRPNYKLDYDDFFKEINASIEDYHYFIKTDISSFFSNINVNLLVSRIDEICNARKQEISHTKLLLYKELLAYCGDGRFPLIENSLASSYLATIVYLDDIDCKLYQFIEEKVPAVQEFRCVRFVDDLYILIKTGSSESELHSAYNQIRNEYSSLLKEYGLALNTSKCCLRSTHNISEELKKSLYDEYYNGEKHLIAEQFSSALPNFLDKLLSTVNEGRLDNSIYSSLIEECFTNPDVEFTAGEVLNALIFDNVLEIGQPCITERIISLIETDISFINIDPKRLTVLIMRTGSTTAIKALLNQLFIRDRADSWNSHDTAVAISYLIQSEFRHIDLLGVLEKRCPRLYDYYKSNCKNSFTWIRFNRTVNSYIDIAGEDLKTMVLYFLYRVELKKKSILSAFAFYKNFFDRFSAALSFKTGHDPRERKPNYKLFYKEKELCKLYAGIPDSESLIGKAHDLRNANPISHASAELIENENTTEDLQNCISGLSKLINDYRVLHGL